MLFCTIPFRPLKRRSPPRQSPAAGEDASVTVIATPIPGLNPGMPAQGVQRRGALAGEQLARPVAHQLGLVVDSAHRHEALTGAHRRLANRRRIGRVVLVAPDIGLHVRGRDQLDLEAEPQQLPPPMMRRRAASLAKNCASAPRRSLRVTTTSSFASTPWTWNAFFARSSPTRVASTRYVRIT